MTTRVWFSIIIVAAALNGEDRATATGTIVDAAGKPVDHATVIVHSAGLRTGYGIFCPTCYTDCGKRAVTDPSGAFAIPSLDPKLLFTLLVVKEGYSTQYSDSIDPPNPAVITLKPRPAIRDASQMMRGKIVDPQGKPLPDVLIQPQAVQYNDPGRGMTGTYGVSGWVDSSAVTNDSGEFEMAFGRPAEAAILLATPRGMAPKLFMAKAGGEAQPVKVIDGAMIRGRLVFKGKPVANAELGLIRHSNIAGTTYKEILIGTREDGTFAIANIPVDTTWMLYPKMESLASRDMGADAIICETKSDGQEIDVGDIQLKPTFTIRGKIVLSDGKPVPPRMHVHSFLTERIWSDTQFLPIDAEGRFRNFMACRLGFYFVSPGGQQL